MISKFQVSINLEDQVTECFK